MNKKSRYERPALVRAGRFGTMTAGTIRGCAKELIFARPPYLCS
ncbi:hypothetical protein Q0Z83_064720 [Actinoplanes sichuanensis]|uniref:Keywimysin-related RiPP n=1 Tax=Actinoplanes sichuanensis TaxID=512349 RepID=A0ABW4ALS7_9ACTN|nr:keywimysin-related RiPP [Actinoplanes sichuanensis]BEL08281.1 hypothetical protein Q0Z83_064720 [Actinoplanes sichuanensis]